MGGWRKRWPTNDRFQYDEEAGLPYFVLIAGGILAPVLISVGLLETRLFWYSLRAVYDVGSCAFAHTHTYGHTKHPVVVASSEAAMLKIKNI